MSQAKNMKLKEYGTSILAHEDTGMHTPQTRNVRNNNTFKSSAFSTEPDEQLSPPQKRSAKSRENLFKSKPIMADIQRASYQDSNIFGYKSGEDLTVQNSAVRQDKGLRVRQNPTFDSRVFSPQKGGEMDANFEEERPKSRNRVEDKWQSSVFEGPIQEEATRKKKIPQKDAGQEGLFGTAKIDYENKASNYKPILQQKKAEKSKYPQRKEKTAEQRKNEELYGKTTLNHQGGKKKDGTLMGAAADWRNMQQTHTNGKTLNEAKGANAKEKKHTNLASNIFGAEEASQHPVCVETEKAQFGSGAGWTSQAAHQKVFNKKGKIDTYQKRKNELASSVFDLPDYSEYVPMTKKKVDVNNMHKQQKAKDHMYSDILGANNEGRQVRSPNKRPAADLTLSSNNWSTTDLKTQIRKDYSEYNRKNQKHDQLRSAFDSHTFVADPSRKLNTDSSDPNLHSVDIQLNCKSSRATKMRDLSSDVLGTGNTLSKYNQETNGKLVDLDLKCLPAQIDQDQLKKIANVKQVISVTIDTDTIKNECTGTGRMKVRLGPNETTEKVMLQFLKKGYGVAEHSDNPKKKSVFTNEMALRSVSPAKNENRITKQDMLKTSNHELFGNTGNQQAIYMSNMNNNNNTQMNSAKKSFKDESMALSNWSRVGGKR